MSQGMTKNTAINFGGFWFTAILLSLIQGLTLPVYIISKGDGNKGKSLS